ncbi:CRISPR-associated helicase Cas3' [Methylocella sp.]|uniref:CRISPR-associated helicase Cas3' n=1 Tax=Methylocella sp. TaxID=1978226 RepID=UPI003784AF38
MAIYAHSAPSPDAPAELLADHLEQVARLARQRGEKFGAGDWAETAARLHDFGKVDPKFQSRLNGSREPFDHSGPGGALASRLYHPHVAAILAPIIAGHHTGLMDATHDGEAPAGSITPLDERLKGCVARLDAQKKAWEAEGLSYPPQPTPSRLATRRENDRERAFEAAAFTFSFFARMVFSTLVDADFIATESFYGEKDRGFSDVSLVDLKARLDAYLLERSESARRKRPGVVNDVRAKVLAACRCAAQQAQGVFTLAAPTGAGKTLASLAFALDHAITHGLDRVIVVIPYTSVVEQTAGVFRDALNRDDVVLEHHGAFDDEKLSREAPEMQFKLRLAQENWDAPIVVTTAVQFFESLFHNRTSRCRKLHNIARSVAILDEAQTLPISVLRPILVAIDELARNYRTSVVLSTATQPAVLENAASDRSFPGGLRDVRPILQDETRLFEILRRVEIENAGPLDDAALAERIGEADQILTIVNTRRHARELFRRIAGLEGARHLSTMMCAAHRAAALARIREDLKAKRPVRVVSTSLIEAGVDIDFPLVMRAAAGLDQIAQAAGRCNREGERAREESFVTVFESEDAYRHKEMEQRWAATKSVLRRLENGELPGAPLDPPAIEAYFNEWFWTKDRREFDQNGLLELLAAYAPRRKGEALKLPMESLARRFSMIDDAMAPIIIPFDETARELINALRHAQNVGGLARKLQRYLVNMPPRDRSALIHRGAAEIIRPDQFGEQFVVLPDLSLYRDDVGLDVSDPTFTEAGSLVT